MIFYISETTILILNIYIMCYIVSYYILIQVHVYRSRSIFRVKLWNNTEVYVKDFMFDMK